MNKTMHTIFYRAVPCLLALLISACSSQPTNDDFQFRTSKESLNEARKNFRRSDNNFLAILLVDHNGKVVKVKKLGSKLDDTRKDLKVVKELYNVQFAAVQPSAQEYREFILPYTVGISSSRSATETTLNAYEPQDLLDEGLRW
ncbi:hypothetical protein [Sessilibacter corallicola]|uniref:hypothetical protein n=1 Tax=Sessilibacter corallicola TaxID=2904075 RepID=UPI0033425402